MTNSATPNLSGLRVLVVPDWLVAWAGAERCLAQILELFPQAGESSAKYTVID